MNIKSDIEAYKKGDRAAEMRLAAFVAECEVQLDQTGLKQIVDAGGRISIFAKNAITRIVTSIQKAKKDRLIKEKIKQCLSSAEAAGILTSPEKAPFAWVPFLKEASALRWSARADQELYNIDLRIRRMLAIARNIGIAI